MRLASFFSLVLLSEAVGRVSGNSCLDRVSANTMAVFSGAPFALAPRYDNGSACAGYCDGLAECHAWLYSARGGDCQLYKKTALSTFPSQHFMYGVCGGGGGGGGGGGDGGGESRRLPSATAASVTASSAVVGVVGSPTSSDSGIPTPAAFLVASGISNGHALSFSLRSWILNASRRESTSITTVITTMVIAIEI
ncbi:uncharacterized protein BO66DRAFT_462037 [Aspergillus aculeatinus CBS 121060]|uniref:Uncharacterized protein n=1 Tax=Aspergillus aculeatinus CBS 121060 TaxID=1448322 RepID=A0ACD1GW65_9EURO|nr:hypothetical protein BO66DRAFT_462037 [Aspergillus aculeatinus CBS 121060]RAH65561.1 hypothetical protein BO66DRAFT_462037 [Aspergillus aculeatinus CBS 121060]